MTTKTKTDLTMGTDQFAELMAAVARALPRDMTSSESQKWIDDQKKLTRVLRKVLKHEPQWELYLHPRQAEGKAIRGFDLLKHHEDTGRINQAYSLDHPLVQGWIENPETYPDYLKGKAVFLWGFRREFDGNPKVACLIWNGGRVIVLWVWLENLWSSFNPALLANLFISLSLSGERVFVSLIKMLKLPLCLKSLKREKTPLFKKKKKY